MTLALAMRYPDLPSAIVMVEAPVVRPADARAALPRFLEQLRGADYREVIRGYFSNVLFISSDDQERKERIVQQMSSAPQHVVVATVEGARDYDPTEAGGGLTVPGFYVAANEPQPRSDMSKASADFEALGNGETLGGAGVLSDTSGGFPRLGIIGMMGLAVAAVSLVVLMRLVRTS